MVSAPPPIDSVLETPHYAIIQEFLDTAFPGGAIVDIEAIAYQSSISDLQYDLPNGSTFSPDKHVELKLNKSTGFYETIKPKPVSVKPVLVTNIQPNRERNQQNSVEALLGRNADVPQNSVAVNNKRVAELSVLKFFDSYVRPDAVDAIKSFTELPISINQQDLYDWSQRSGKNVIDWSMDNIGIHERLPKDAMNVYSFQIKPEVKPKLDSTSHMTVQVLQTIACHPQTVTQIMSPIFKIVAKRINSVLKSNVLIFSDASPDELIQQINDHKQVKFGEELYVTEIDISKYDKSQGELALEIDLLLLKLFGVDDFFLELWRTAHVKARLVGTAAGITSPTLYQRKSGDAWTFGGNTCLTMCVVAATLDLASDDFYSRQSQRLWGITRGVSVPTKPFVSYAMFAGDDSLIMSSVRMTDDSQKMMSDFFNFETKVFSFVNSYYFCSKFIIDICEQMFIVADPIKTFFKLGRTSMQDFSHVEEYRVSLYDLFKRLQDPNIRRYVAAACVDRYSLKIDPEAAIAALSYLVCNPRKFSELFVYPEKVNKVYAVDSAVYGKVPSLHRGYFKKNKIPMNPRKGDYIYKYSYEELPNRICLYAEYPLVVVPTAGRELRYKLANVS